MKTEEEEEEEEAPPALAASRHVGVSSCQSACGVHGASESGDEAFRHELDNSHKNRRVRVSSSGASFFVLLLFLPPRSYLSLLYSLGGAQLLSASTGDVIPTLTSSPWRHREARTG